MEKVPTGRTPLNSGVIKWGEVWKGSNNQINSDLFGLAGYNDPLLNTAEEWSHHFAMEVLALVRFHGAKFGASSPIFQAHPSKSSLESTISLSVILIFVLCHG